MNVLHDWAVCGAGAGPRRRRAHALSCATDQRGPLQLLTRVGRGPEAASGKRERRDLVKAHEDGAECSGAQLRVQAQEVGRLELVQVLVRLLQVPCVKGD